jgi:hypothetical protein
VHSEAHVCGARCLASTGPLAGLRRSLTPARPAPPAEKAAGVLDWTLKAEGIRSFGKALLRGPERDPEVEAVKEELDDPDHENELRRIRTRAVLQSFMSDPDDPVSGHSPEEVAAVFNEIAQAAPHAVEQPSVLGPLLRRRLAGGIEPFEAKEMTDIEKGLREARQAPGAKAPAAQPKAPNPK